MSVEPVTAEPKTVEPAPPAKTFQPWRLAARTLRADRRSYLGKARPLSAGRVWRALAVRLDRPLFIVGSPRSGTTFLGDCCATLPELSYHFEPIITKAAIGPIYEGRWSEVQAERLFRRSYTWLMRLHLDGDLRFAEKTPQLSFVVPFLARIFPDAQFLHIIRDGRDVALSYSKKPWLQAASAGCGRYEPGGYPYGPYPRFWVEPERAEEFQTTSDIHRCVWAWRRYTESILEAAQDLPTDRYHELRYETMVRMPEDEAHRILDFLEISRPESRRGFERAMAQAKGGSVGRWQQEIPPSDLARIETEAGSLLRRLGYAG